MKKYIHLDAVKVVLATLAGTAVFSAPLSLQAAVSQQPLSLTEGVPPNILVTLDDSGSMALGYSPDAISGTNNRDSRAARSNAFNSSYFNPTTTYRIPKKVTMVSGQVVVSDYPTPSFTAAPQDGFLTGSTTVNLSSNYQAPWGTLAVNATPGFITSCPTGVFPTGVTCSSGRAAAHYFEYTPGTNCPLPAINRNDCYTHKAVTTAEQQNFANWYSYYRTRNLATRSAASLAFYSLPEDLRLTWGLLTSCPIGSGNTSTLCQTNTIGRFAGQHRVNFFNWLSALPHNGYTPLHNAMINAGSFLQNNEKAYKDETGNSYACRASYHILMTDGMWNQRTTDNNAKYDNALDYPYKDDRTDTLADWAYHYWRTDLRPALANEIKPFIPYKNAGDTSREFNDPRNNPATWQHMVNFTVGLGLSNSLTNSTAPTWTGSTFGNLAELQDPNFNSKRWPAVGNDSRNNVYDLWHAAINSRGEFFSADTPETLVAAFDNILSRIADRATAAAAPAINSGLQDDGSGDPTSFSYQTSYASSESWSGDLKAFRTIRQWDPAAERFVQTTAQQWSAKQLLDAKAAATRNIRIADGASGLKDFTWANAGVETTQGTLAYWLRQNPDNGDTLDTGTATAQNRLAFLRGNRALEGTTFRSRTTVLGDFVHSKPVTVRGARYLVNFANRLENNVLYTRFYEEQRARPAHVYVGSNDGMLHSFNAQTGEETFAFIPTAVFPKLHKLTGKNYEGAFHQFYVDGTPTVADVFIKGNWRTVLVGTLRAGGKGLFALDITDPATPTLLWQFDDSKIPANNAVRLGYSFPQPTIARLHNGNWAVVTGNGYESTNHTNGKAALLIIDMATGTLTKSLEVQGVDGVINGLSTPKLADMNVDGVADYAYAGDLQGNMWRFNLAPTNTTPFKRLASETTAAETSFKVSYNGNPLYRAISANGQRQPITSAPTIVRHPTRFGHIITFGTGKFYEEGDKNGATGVSQSIYGIWDTNTTSTSGNEAAQPSGLTRNKLQQQTMNSVLEPSTGGEARLLTDRTVNWAVPPVAPSTSWTDTSTHKYGWYFDFALGREMMIENINMLGQTLFFQTLVPNSDPCASGAENWSYAINPYTGGRTLHHAFVNTRSTNTTADPVVSAVRQDGEGGTTIGQDPDGEFKLCTGLSCITIAPDPASIGRQTWRVVGEQ